MKTTIALLLTAPLALTAFTGHALAAQKDQAVQDQAAYDTIRSGDLQGAEQALTAAQASGQDDPFQMLNLAYVMQKTGRGEAAAVLYREILDMDQNPYAELAAGDTRRVKSIARDGLAYLDNTAQ